MLSRLRGARRRGSAGGRTSSGATLAVVWRTLIQENKVIPPVLAVVALLVFSWVVAGTFVGGTDESVNSGEVASSEGGGEVAQSGDNEAAAPPPPEIESPNTESFAAYESKDPFRSLFTPASADDGTAQDGSDASGGDPANGGSDPGDPANGGSAGSGDGARGGNGGNGPRRDTTSAPNGGNATADQYGNDGSSVGQRGPKNTDETESGGASGGGKAGGSASGGSASGGSGSGGNSGTGYLYDSGGNLPGR